MAMPCTWVNIKETLSIARAHTQILNREREVELELERERESERERERREREREIRSSRFS
jgi:hypothetical protein